jgi:diguanylate cyclase (GGDEF)-like protein/PAS domain S-box-containing protein
MQRMHPVRWLIIGGALLIAVIAVGTTILVGSFRDRALADTERELKNTALILAEQIDRSFQALELVQRSVLEKLDTREISSSEEYERRTSGEDVHRMLVDSIKGLVHVDAVTLIDAKGKLLNFSRYWPIPQVNVSDRDYFVALASDAGLKSYVSAPVRNRGTGTWTIYLARKIAAPDGTFLGLILGAVELSYFEKFFGSIVLREHSSIALMRDDGVLLTRFPKIESAIGRKFMASKEALAEKNSGTIRYHGVMEGKQRILAAQRLPHYPLHLAVNLDVEAALAGWRKETPVLLSAGGLAAASVALMIILIARQFAQRDRLLQQTLALEKQRLDTAINNMTQGLLLFDSSERMIVCNRRYLEMYGLSADVVKPGCTLRDLLRHRKELGNFSGDPEQYRSALLHAVAEGRTGETITESADGRAIRIVNKPLMNGGWVSTHEDITERQRLLRERDRDREFLNQIIDNIPIMIAVKDVTERKFVLANRAAEALWGIPRAQVLGKTARELFPQSQADLIDRYDDAAIESDAPLILDAHPNVVRAGSMRTVVSKRLAIRDSQGKPQFLVSVVEDVTERKRLADRIAHLAHYDALTDLPNRVFFREQLDRAVHWLRPGEHLAVLYLDIDHFKGVNDTLGHPVGDDLLKSVAVRLRGCLRETDIAGRLGGDEFAIVRTAVTDPKDVTDLVNRLQEAIRANYEVGGHQLLADLSIGIAMAPEDGIDPDQLLKNADLAMYGAKSEGRGTYRFFEAEMDARVKARRALEFDLREALMTGGFELYYQPVIDVRQKTIAGCECLLRWQHAKHGMVSPTQFIPIAEETGLITPLGEWVLRTACKDATLWPEGIYLAVNVSPVQFKTGNLVQTVVNALAASGLSADRLELEITENVLIRDDEKTLAVLKQLRQLGVRIAMDDFGTGYSSLAYLQRFPFNKIKIDSSFIKTIAEADGSLPIVEAVVNIAGSREITTTAEGVETEQQLELLRELGCGEVQGYLFSPPQPLAVTLELFGSKAVRAA